MTKKKIARSKRSTKPTARKGATIGEILAERGVVPKTERPIPFTPTAENSEIRRAAERAGIAPANPKPDAWQLTGAPFDGGEGLREDATAADLAGLLFEAPNRRSCGVSVDGFLSDVLLSLGDEIEILGEAMESDFINKEAVARWALRARYRVCVAIEIEKRMRAAEGGAA